MGVRFLQIGIVAFWLFTTGWLVRNIWFPDAGGFTEVDPREVLDRFFGWNESASMALLDNGARIGSVNVSGYTDEDRDGGPYFGFSIAGSLMNREKGAVAGSLSTFGRGMMEFTTDFEPAVSEYSLRVPGKGLSAHMKMEGNPPLVKARATIGGNPIFEHEGDIGGLQSLPISGIAGIPMGGELTSALSMKPKLKAARGSRDFGGREVPVFRLEIALGEAKDQTITIYFTEAGEPLQILTPVGFEAVSEMLVPLDAYLKETELND